MTFDRQHHRQPLPLPKDEWKLTTNAAYQEAMKILTNVTTASLVLPIVFVSNFAAHREGVNWRLAYLSWISLGISLLCAMIFYWMSAKFVKVVCGGRESWSEQRYENVRDWTSWGAIVFFAIGLFFLLWFFHKL